MTEVEFHTGVADRIGFACRLLRKACRQGAQVLVTATEPVLRDLDRQLWTFEEREFVPHVRMPGAPAALAARTPVWLSGDASVDGAPGLVVNLGADAPANLGALRRLIEIVSDDPDETLRGRERWRAYKAAGLEIKHHAAVGSPRE
ncbi:MAG: DNA polymerase III subunit chi [Leptothrix sp. (in: Bacteria)]|nr:DNA polymerase III subunit chi [Leptothrix sp. (in: b-proteobacteria)]